jgi:hypothetical protein
MYYISITLVLYDNFIGTIRCNLIQHWSDDMLHYDTTPCDLLGCNIMQLYDANQSGAFSIF